MLTLIGCTTSLLLSYFSDIQPSTNPPKTKIFVGRLPENAQSADLRKLFEQYGTVTECDILNRYGFVHMKTEDQAARAIENLHNCNFMGSLISVEVIHISPISYAMLWMSLSSLNNHIVSSILILFLSFFAGINWQEKQSRWTWWERWLCCSWRTGWIWTHAWWYGLWWDALRSL